MKHSVWGLVFILLMQQLSAIGQAGGTRSGKPASRAGSHRKAPAPAVPAPATMGLVVPSWLPADAPAQPAATLLNDVLDTKLDLRFDYTKQHALGTAILTLRPHFYPQNQLILDAKGFDIGSVQLLTAKKSKTLSYTYNKRQLTISLDRAYARTESYRVRIAYVAKPNELPAGGSEAITEDKGLYFINPLGKEPNKPRQIWTQGETESNSAWFPTIDKPNQRMTQEITLTVENKFKTLSNGLLISSKNNPNGTRTDTWRQSLPHAPYLAMVAVGNFAVVSDTWCGKSVDDYVEPRFAGTAKAVFGRTPEMLEFFSQKLGVDFPWEKYAQIAVRDYVSGAMENTTATVHGSTIQATKRELLDADYNTGEGTIAHELFHQWFGDYVTSESWANLPLNESFADYSEFLWAEYKYGADQAALIQQAKLNNYLEEAQSKREPLIRYHYQSREDMFDRHSYDKGGRVLHMLRKYVGDEAFFKSLNRYLTQNKLSAVEIAKLRTAFEETTGEDLMWFFDQWFLQRGHPELKVTHSYANNQVSLRVRQTQDSTFSPLFRLPVTVTTWVNDKSTEHHITITRADQTFQLPVSQKPLLVKFDSEGIVLAQVDEARSQEELLYQFYHGRSYLQKYEALDLLQNKVSDLAVSSMMRAALNDPFWAIRRTTLDHLRGYRGPEPGAVRRDIQRAASADVSPKVRAQALATLATLPNEDYTTLYLKALNDSSYTVEAAAIAALTRKSVINPQQQIAALENTPNGTLTNAIATYYAQTGGIDQYNWFLRRLPDLADTDLYEYLLAFGTIMTRIPAVERDKGIKTLEIMARTHPKYFVRLGAYRGLSQLQESMPQLKTMLQDIKAKETDQRLKSYYNLM